MDYFAEIPSDNLYDNSTTSLVKLRNILSIRFPRTMVGVKRPSVVVPFGFNKSENTEIVPADYIGNYKGMPIYEIPDNSGYWMQSCPDLHNYYIRKIDGLCNNKVKSLIRFIKAWKYFANVPITSFYLELRIAKLFSNGCDIVYSYDTYRIFNWLVENRLPLLQDPIGISGYIYPYKSDFQYNIAMSKLKTAQIRAAKALIAENEEKINQAFHWWKMLFGSRFPNYYY